MSTGLPFGTTSLLSRCVSAEVRAMIAARRSTLRRFASLAGFGSHNYVAIRLRDERPFTLDDLERICDYFKDDPAEFLRRAYSTHMSQAVKDLDADMREWEEMRAAALRTTYSAVADGGDIDPVLAGEADDLASKARAAQQEAIKEMKRKKAGE